MNRMIGYQSETAKRRTKMPVSIRKLFLHLENKFIPRNGLVSGYHQDSTRPFFTADLWVVKWYLPLGKELFLLAIKIFKKVSLKNYFKHSMIHFKTAGRDKQCQIIRSDCAVFSLSAGCWRNSPAEKVAITGWIFGQRLLVKAQRALPPTI